MPALLCEAGGFPTFEPDLKGSIAINNSHTNGDTRTHTQTKPQTEAPFETHKHTEISKIPRHLFLAKQKHDANWETHVFEMHIRTDHTLSKLFVFEARAGSEPSGLRKNKPRGSRKLAA